MDRWQGRCLRVIHLDGNAASRLCVARSLRSVIELRGDHCV